MTLEVLRRYVPMSLRRVARAAWKRQEFGRAMHRLMALAPGAAPQRQLLADLQAGWDNKGFTAEVDYLAELARLAVGTAGPVLECGSGLTTVLLGALAGRRGVDIWTLEHDPGWWRRVTAALRRHGLPEVHLCLSDLRDYGDFTWYDPPLGIMPQDFRLVVCDGPPGTTPGGRFGLVPVMRDRLPLGAVILLDDADRVGEQLALRRWTSEASLRVTFGPLSGERFAWITRC